MNLRQLECFVAVAEDGSFTKAARRLQLSQPSLSQHIRRRERELGGELIERLPRGIRLTAAGNAFLPQAEAAVRAADRAAASARAALGLEAGELEVAILLSIAVGPRPAAWQGPVEALGHEELVVVLPSSDPLAGQEVVPLEALADRS